MAGKAKEKRGKNVQKGNPPGDSFCTFLSAFCAYSVLSLFSAVFSSRTPRSSASISAFSLMR